MTLRQYRIVTRDLARIAVCLEVVSWFLIIYELKNRVLQDGIVGLLLGDVLFASWGLLCALPLVDLGRVMKLRGCSPSDENLTLVLNAPGIGRRILLLTFGVTIILWFILDVFVALTAGAILPALSLYVTVRVSTLMYGHYAGEVLFGRTLDLRGNTHPNS